MGAGKSEEMNKHSDEREREVQRAKLDEENSRRPRETTTGARWKFLQNYPPRSRTFNASVEGSRDFVHPLLQPCSLFSGVCRLFFHYNEPFAKRRRCDAAMRGATSIMANGHSAWSEFRGRWSIKRGEREETRDKSAGLNRKQGEE